MSFVQGDRGTPSSSPFDFEEVVEWDWTIFRDWNRESNLDSEGGSSRQVESIADFPEDQSIQDHGTASGAEGALDVTKTMQMEDLREPASLHNLWQTQVSTNHPPHPSFQPRPINRVSALTAGPSIGSKSGKFKKDRKPQKSGNPKPASTKKKYLYNMNTDQIRDETERNRVLKAMKCKMYREELKKKSRTNDRICLNICHNPELLIRINDLIYGTSSTN